MNIRDIINNIYTLPNSEMDKLALKFSTLNLPKGTTLFKSNKLENNLYFIGKVLVRAFYYHNENEITFWFGREGEPILSMQSYINNKPGYETIELLEDSCLYKINTFELQKLYSDNVHIANWGRKIAENELLKTEESFISRQFKTALERYQDLIKYNPDLIKRVQLGYIASYLGITQVSLSRIRGEIK